MGFPSWLLFSQCELDELSLGDQRFLPHPRGAVVGDQRGEGSATKVVEEVAQGNTAWEAARMDAWVNSATEEQDWALPSSLAKQRGNSAPCYALVTPTKAKAALTPICTTANVFGFLFALNALGAKTFVVQGSGELLSITQL